MSECRFDVRTDFEGRDRLDNSFLGHIAIPDLVSVPDFFPGQSWPYRERRDSQVDFRLSVVPLPGTRDALRFQESVLG